MRRACGRASFAPVDARLPEKRKSGLLVEPKDKRRGRTRVAGNWRSGDGRWCPSVLGVDGVAGTIVVDGC